MSYCAECGTEAEQNDEFCRDCGARLTNVAESETTVADGYGHGTDAPTVSETHRTPVATEDEFETEVLPRRIGAVIVDSVVVTLGVGVLFGLIGLLDSPSGLFLGYMVFYPAYFAVAEGKTGRTPGKAVFGLRVVTATGDPLSDGEAIIRNVLRFFDGILYYLVGFITILASDNNQRLGDMAADTLVIRDP